MSISAYKRTIAETENPRQIERRILARVTSGMSSVQEEFDKAELFEKNAILNASLRSTLSDNVNFWALMKVDLISPSNSLPADLRASLASMAIFVENHTAKVLSGNGNLSLLIDVNKSILAGLSGIVPEEA